MRPGTSLARRLLAVAGLLVALPTFAMAVGDTAVAHGPDEHLVRVDDLLARGALDAAESTLAPLLDALPTLNDARRTADVLRRLAALRRAQLRHADAEAPLRNARDIYASLDALADLGVMERELGGVYWTLGRQREASLAYTAAAHAFAAASRRRS